MVPNAGDVFSEMGRDLYLFWDLSLALPYSRLTLTYILTLAFWFASCCFSPLYLFLMAGGIRANYTDFPEGKASSPSIPQVLEPKGEWRKRMSDLRLLCCRLKWELSFSWIHLLGHPKDHETPVKMKVWPWGKMSRESFSLLLVKTLGIEAQTESLRFSFCLFQFTAFGHKLVMIGI